MPAEKKTTETATKKPRAVIHGQFPTEAIADRVVADLRRAGWKGSYAKRKGPRWAVYKKRKP